MSNEADKQETLELDYRLWRCGERDVPDNGALFTKYTSGGTKLLKNLECREHGSCCLGLMLEASGLYPCLLHQLETPSEVAERMQRLGIPTQNRAVLEKMLDVNDETNDTASIAMSLNDQWPLRDVRGPFPWRNQIEYVLTKEEMLAARIFALQQFISTWIHPIRFVNVPEEIQKHVRIFATEVDEFSFPYPSDGGPDT